MPAVVIVGAQLGDEGKGKITDLYADKADMVVRFNGGANAGHTLVANGKKIVTHLIPSGVMRPHITCVLGNGMVIDPEELVKEIMSLREHGFLARDNNLLISKSAHLVTPWHRWLDGNKEDTSLGIGTTRKGIGPAYETKAARKGARMEDLLDRSKLEELFNTSYGFYSNLQHGPVIDSFMEAGKILAPYMVDVSEVVNDALDAKKNVIIEGAQAALLDIDHGNYPYVSSSSSTAGGACASLGIGPKRIDCVLGVAKVYTTAVGRMPFPTEMDEATANLWREAGGEFGSTTGRPRRVGWLDIVALKKAIRMNGMDQLAWVKLDVFFAQEKRLVCVDYEDGLPLYEDWSESKDPQRLIRYLETLTGIRSCLYSTGPGREETVVNFHPFK